MGIKATIKVSGETSEYGNELAAITVRGGEWTEAAALVHRAAAMLYEAAGAGDLDLTVWAICPDVERGRVVLEPSAKATTKDWARAYKTLDRVEAILRGRGGYASGRNGERLYISIPE